MEVNTDLSIDPSSEQGRTLPQVEEELRLKEEENEMLRRRLDSLTCSARKPGAFGSELIEGYDKRTRFYMGLPVFGLFVLLVQYVESKAGRLREWCGAQLTSSKYNSRGRKPWTTIPIANQLFAVLVRLRLNLCGQDISDRMGIPESTFSKLFSTWVLFLA